MFMRLTLAVALLLPLLGVARAADRDMANGLCAAGRAHAAKGNAEQAKDNFYKALANDESCPDAVYELARIFDAEGNTAAASEFFQRASVLLAQDIKPGNAAKRTEALQRVKVLNPFAPRMTSLFEDYAQDLDKLVRRNADALTQDTAVGRVQELKLSTILAPDKMPKFFATAVAEKEKEKAEKEKPPARTPSRSSSSSSFSSVHEKNGTTLPDVEKELKALGWTKIVGSFVKKGPGVYEATDAKLEAPFINGTISVTVVKEGTKGSMKATARSEFNQDTTYSSSSEYYYMPGFGFYFKGKEYREYGPAVAFNNSIEPYSLGRFDMPEGPKVNFVLLINAGEFEFQVNGRRNNKLNHNKTPKSGPFAIDVNGTVILENPRCVGGQ